MERTCEPIRNRQWGQICPFDICARSIVTKLRQRPLSEPPDPVRCRGVTHSTPPFPASQPTYRSDLREKIGSSSRRDATVRSCRIPAFLGPQTICQMDRSDPIAPPSGLPPTLYVTTSTSPAGVVVQLVVTFRCQTRVTGRPASNEEQLRDLCPR